MSQVHEQVVQRQFGATASAYLTSAVHAQGEEFATLRMLLAAEPGGRVLDLGCGAGHVSFQVADLATEVVAYDLSEGMLAVVAETAAARGLSNIVTERGAAERLPFADASFDAVFSRYSAHHWSDLGAALREVRRVLRPGGRVVFIDVASPGRPLLDTYLQAVEVLRDNSHVHNYSAAEWACQLAEAGLDVTAQSMQRLRLEFASWVARMRTPELMQQAIHALQQGVGDEVRRHFAVEADGSFTVDVIVLQAKKS